MRDPAGTTHIDVYLFPAAIGGGRGDIDEVLVAGRVLEGAGARVRILRLGGRSLPGAAADLGSWPRFSRVGRIRSSRGWAITVSPSWGVTAAPRRPGRLGGAGPWAPESAEVERCYGPERTVHVSFEEFARTLSSRAQTIERYREGGWTRPQIRRLTRTRRFRREVAEFRVAYRRFRAFEVPNVLSVFPGFVRSEVFGREFPRAIQTGPLWPGRFPRRIGRIPSRWLWYVNSPSATRLVPGLRTGLSGPGPPVRVGIRGRLAPHPGISTEGPWRILPAMSPQRWERRFATAGVRIVTGSRSLLDALEAGGPFLYFNGVTGDGRRTRRHRPEKLQQLLRVFAAAGGPPARVRDLRSFALARRVPQIVGAARTPEWQLGFPRTVRVQGYLPPFDSANSWLVDLLRHVRRAAAEGGSASSLVAELRRGSHGRRPSGSSGKV
jgi:hypothetical protein